MSHLSGFNILHGIHYRLLFFASQTALMHNSLELYFASVKAINRLPTTEIKRINVKRDI
ncbi:hypothetical protein Fmac_020142 [Flemingia macrophylla]|uniref:Uncharacterized protein n=1 Tax=Flemingia macrophylla TaxID=520843 RepID=A0ABD1M9U3_9FABA